MSAATPLFVWLRLRLESLYLTLCVFLVLTISKSFDCVDHEAPFDKLQLEEFKEPSSECVKSSCKKYNKRNLQKNWVVDIKYKITVWNLIA